MSRAMPDRVRIINGEEVEDYDNFAAAQDSIWDFVTSNDLVSFYIQYDEVADLLTITLA